MQRNNDLIVNAKKRLGSMYLAGNISKNDESKVCNELDALERNGESLNLVNTIINTPDDILIKIITKR